jgi:abortive infection Abi-like protein
VPHDDAEYQKLREELLSEPAVKDVLPRFVRTCRDVKQFWALMKQKSDNYHGRKIFLWEEFSPALQALEEPGSPADKPVSDALSQFDPEHIHQIWKGALARRADDPEGAITSARTLLETVCKHIIDESGIAYGDDSDLPKLYRLTAEVVDLAPSQQTEPIFKQIFGGCQTVVDGLGALRNKLSDAHGRGKMPAKPEERHAELAVNLAGAMATFLVETWEARRTGKI